MRGEKSLLHQSPGHWPGSPPRARGEEILTNEYDCTIRITPACAGRSSNAFGIDLVRGDHPRVCGEKISSTLDFSGMVGSPPRVRGEVKDIMRISHICRITPACAGRRQDVSDV